MRCSTPCREGARARSSWRTRSDTPYKQALLERLTRAYSDERLARAGELSLSGGTQTEVVCDLVFEGDWRGTLEHRYFTASDLQAEVEQ